MMQRNLRMVVVCAIFVGYAAICADQSAAAENQLAIAVAADTMIAFDINSTGTGAFGNGLEQSTPHGGLNVMHLRGGNPHDPASITAKPLIRFDLGPTGGFSKDDGLPYFIELETEQNGNSNDTFRIYAIDDAATRNFNEGTLTWDNAPAVAKDSFQDFEAAGDEVGVFFRPNTLDNTASRIPHPIMGSQVSTFESGGNTCATFGFTSTQTNRWRIRSKELPVGDEAKLYTYDVTESATSGALNTAATWGGSAPAAANLYRVNSGHTVTVDGVGAFSGAGVVVNNGTLNFTANDVNVPLIVLNAGGNITNSTGTSLSIGDPSITEEQVEFGGGGLIVNKDLTYSASVGQEDLSINVPLVSYNDFTFNGVSGSDLTMRFPATHRGTINFDGSGDNVVLNSDWGIGGTLVMNSTGANRVKHDGDDSEHEFDKGTIVFNQSGTVVHSATDLILGSALQGVGNLQVNAAVTIDLSTAFPTLPDTSDRRFQITRNLTGSAPITVQGTPANPTGPNNQFEVGVNTARFTEIREVGYSGTITTQDFAVVEAHAGMPNAKVVVNPNGLLAAGFIPHEDVPNLAEPTVEIGEIVLAKESAVGAADGGQLDVGYRSGNGARSPQNLRLTKSGGQNGNLTMADGSELTMQINGAPNQVAPQPGDPGNCSGIYDESNPCQYNGPLFDTIEVEGTATLDGELVIRVNVDVPFSVVPSGTEPADPQYFPITTGDTWDIITAVSSTSPVDFDGLNGVDAADLAIWQAGYGLDATGDADGDGDTDGSDFLMWQRDFGSTGTLGSITGTFDSVSFVDDSIFGFGLSATQKFQVKYVSATLVQLELIDTALLAAAGAVPEPSSLALVGLAFAGLCLGGRGRY